MPTRVQRTRRRGQPGMPPGAVYVGRPGKWGNPFPAYGGSPEERAHAARLFTVLLATRADHPHPEHVVAYPSDEEIREHLADRDLACWCPLPEPGEPDHCHAAVLLRLAAGEPL
ncbi:DUF4326 domain-containing protein [Streptomyces aculeolatus]|uniref:DUF4326 domain-containing protein n=1 Tax=Streptomyces aculeolatus TaxID=270689 RepID=UPI001CEDC2D6|nr:DUF4326 domain-containing protein [Streptomyces aculeolatus]